MNPLTTVKSGLIKKLPKELVHKLIEHYSEIKNNFTLLRHENTELNGSKFSEIVFRIIEFVVTGKYTPLGKQIRNFTDRCRQFEQKPSTGIDDTIRIHIPRTLVLITDVRNKRGVGHVSGIHNPNLPDSILVTKCCDWILAELVRVFSKLSLDDAQKLVDQLVEIDSPYIAKIGGKRRVLLPQLTYPQQVLLLLYEEYPSCIDDRKLFEWVEHSNFSSFKQNVLKRLHTKRFIEYDNRECLILPPGRKHVENTVLRHS